MRCRGAEAYTKQNIVHRDPVVVIIIFIIVLEATFEFNSILLPRRDSRVFSL
jgi:hypothetical protein